MLIRNLLLNELFELALLLTALWSVQNNLIYAHTLSGFLLYIYFRFSCGLALAAVLPSQMQCI